MHDVRTPIFGPVLGRTLERRAVDLTEIMDDPACDPVALDRTYRYFKPINAVVSGWRRVYARHLRPHLSAHEPTTLLDIGSGGGDVPRALARWAARDGLRLAITAVDPDERAHRYVTAQPPTPGVEFRQASSGDLVRDGETFDLVTSNHLLHHLDHDTLASLLAHSAVLARRLVVHADIERGRLAYAAYAAGTWPLARRSFVYDDGLASVRRSYRPHELAAVVPPGWEVRTQLPYRLLLVRDVTDATAREEARRA